jgi:hypothetical protein
MTNWLALFLPIYFESQSSLIMNPSLQPAGHWAIPAPTVGTARPPLTAIQKLLLPLGVVLFDWLFWRERGGVNMLVFNAFVVVAQLPRHAAAWRSAYFWLMVFGTLLNGVFMAIYGSAVAALASAVSVVLLLGYANQPTLKHHRFGQRGRGVAAGAA